MALTIVVRSGDSKSPPRVTFDAPRIVIGRGEGCDVRLPDPSVSHRHASIRQRGSEYLVVDEGSTNGTFVGPVRLSPHAPRVLRAGETVRIGRIWLELTVEHAVPTTNPGMATREIALGLVAEALAAQGEPSAARVRVVEGPDRGRELKVSEPGRAYLVGRGQGADLVLEDQDASRRHVEIIRRGTELLVRDLGSKNGARFGDQPLEPDKETTWSAGVVLAVGANRFSCEDPVAEALAELERSADERMRDDDSVDPPNVSSATEDDAGAAPPIARPIPEGGASPIARVPGGPYRSTDAPRGWTMTDIVVALIALSVLGLSILGLIWLFRST